MGMNFPDTPALNQVHGSYTWDGEKWVFSPTGGVAVLVAVDPPVGAADNSLWWESDTGILYMYYNDGTSKQWVAVMASGNDPTRVSKAGDTMTGALTFTGVTPALRIDASTAASDANGASILLMREANPLYGAGIYHGVDASSVDTLTFGVASNADPLAPASAKMRINTSVVTITPNQLVLGGTADVTYYFGNTGARHLRHDGTDFTFAGGYAKAPTPPVADKSTKLATTEFVKTWAAPFDALAYNGMQINGSAEVAQELGYANSPLSGGGAQFCDGWASYKVGSMAGVVKSNSFSVTPGLKNCLTVLISTAQASLASGDRTIIFQNFEGHRMTRLAWGTANARPLTIGFWSVHARPGLYTGAVTNFSDRSCAFSYTQNAGGASEYKVVTIPGCTDGTWATDSTAWGNLIFMVAGAGGVLAPSTGVWHSTIYQGAVGQVNGVAATSDIFGISGVVVLPGIEAPSAAQSPLIMRPYDQELVTCKRYWQKLGGANASEVFVSGYCGAPNQTVGTTLVYPVEMRANPNVGIIGTWTVVNTAAVGTGAFNFAGTKSSAFALVSLAAGYTVAFNNANSGVSFDARL